MEETIEQTVRKPQNRPKNHGWVMYHVLLKPEQSEALKAFAEREDWKQSPLIRKAVDQFLAKELGET